MYNSFRLAGVMIAAAAAVGCASIPETTSEVPDYSAAPNYGTLNLDANFTPDPVVVQLESGGHIPASNVSPECTGYIARAPDVRLNYSADDLPLILSVASRSDTTLVVNAPDGRWYCNDDGGVNGMNPAIRFNSPQSGQYDIWVGTYGSGSLESAQLHVSEVSSQ